MRLKTAITFLLVFAASLSFSFADEIPNHPLTLPELVNIALENNPSTRQAWWNARRAAAALGTAKSAYYPRVDFEASATNGRDFKFINGPDVEYTIVGADLFLNYLLYDFGERKANVLSASQSLIAANWQVDWNVQRVMVKVLENAYATLHAQEVLKASIQSLHDAEVVLLSAQELNRAGLTPVSDVYSSQASYSQMKMEVTQHKALLAIQLGKLASSLGLCANTDIEVAPIDALDQQTCLGVDKLIAVAMEQRADLIAQQARVQSAIANESRVCAAYKPKISFFGQGGYNHAFSDKTDGAQYRISIDFEAPIFTGFEATYRSREAYAMAQLSAEEQAQLELDIALEVLTHSESVTASRDMLPDAQQDLESSTKAYECVLERYKAGKERIAEVSIAQRQLALARVRYSDVKTRWFVSVANLAYATGTLVQSMESPCSNTP